MKSQALNKLRLNITSCQFVITLLEVSALNTGNEKPMAQSRYILELQKGAQILKKFNTRIQLNKDSKFYFSEQENVKIKVFNPKSINYYLAIYKQKDRKQHYIKSQKIQILETFQVYTSEIKSKIKDYSAILEKIEHKEQFGVHWRQFKASCIMHHQIISKNIQGLFQLTFMIQIKSQLDFLAENQQTKIKFKGKKSNESSLSTNSKSRKHQESYLSTHSKTISRCLSEFKSIDQNKENLLHRASTIGEFSQVFVLQNNHSRTGSQIQQKPLEFPQQTKILHIPIHSIIKKNQNLSDTIEASYEGESLMNSGGDKTDRKCKQMPQIKQQEQLIIPTIKTSHLLQKQEDSPRFLRRNSSLKIWKKISSREEIEQNETQQSPISTYTSTINQTTQKYPKGLLLFLLMISLIYIFITAKFLFEGKKLNKSGNFKSPKMRSMIKHHINLFRYNQ